VAAAAVGMVPEVAVAAVPEAIVMEELVAQGYILTKVDLVMMGLRELLEV
jgi:hypothetical protein